MDLVAAWRPIRATRLAYCKFAHSFIFLRRIDDGSFNDAVVWDHISASGRQLASKQLFFLRCHEEHFIKHLDEMSQMYMRYLGCYF